MLALSRFRDSNYRPVLSEDAYQQMRLEQYLLPYREKILDSDIPEKAITEITYTLIDQKIKEYVRVCKNEFHVDYVALLGGIIINTDYGLDDYFDTRNFEVVELKAL